MSGGFSFGTPAGGAAGGTGGFSFGSAATTSAPTGGFSFGTPAASTASTGFGTTPSTASTLGGTGTTAFGATPATSAAGGTTLFGTPAGGAAPTTAFGAAATPAASTSSALTFGSAATSTAATAGPTTGGFSFGSATAPATSTGAGMFGAQTSAAPAAFGATAAATSTGTGFTGFGAATTTTTASTGGVFGASQPVGGATSTFGTIAGGAGGGAGGGFGGTGAAGQTAQQQQQQAPTLTTCPLGTMTFEDLEKKCNEWKKELDLQEESFLKRATQINAWDRLVTANSEKITELNEYMKKVKGDQERLDRELDFVVAQQKELEEMLEPLEQQASAMESASIQHHTDVERASTYQSATKVNNQLRMMADAIKDIIEHINDSNKTTSDNSAMDQISKILNAHMDALQYIQNGIGTLQEKTEDINKLMGVVRM